MRDIYGTGGGMVELILDEGALEQISNTALYSCMDSNSTYIHQMKLFKALRTYLLSRGLKVNWDIGEEDVKDKA